MPLTILQGPNAASLEPLADRAIAILGYGNQGRAHALNLRDSGVHVIVGCRSDGAGAARAAEDGFARVTIEQAAAAAHLAVIALPDEVQPEVYRQSIAPHLKSGRTLGFIHGFNIRFGFIAPPHGIGVVMVAPKGPGQTLRERFVEGRGIPCLFAVHQENAAGDAEALGLAWAAGIGCARAAIIRTTFADETETDLFGEQAVLCGGLTALILAAFETLVDAGYPPELAYLECCHEVKQIADLVYAKGLASMMESISNTAEFGAHRAGPVLIDDSVRERMRALPAEIRSGAFAQALRDDHQAGFLWFEQQRVALRAHPIDPAGRAVRDLMPWLRDWSP